MNRNRLTDLMAVAAMPGLEAIATTIDEYLPPPQRRCRGGRNSLAMAVYLAGKGVIASDSELDSMLREPMVWDAMRASAARVGRELPECPPTKDHHEQLIRNAREGLAPALNEQLICLAIDIARQADMLNARRGESLQLPRPENVLLADGVGISLMSRVRVQDGVVVGSRAKPGGTPRISESFRSKPTEGHKGTLPYVAVSAHGRSRWKRIVFGIEGFRSGDEINTAASLLDRVLTNVGEGAQAVATTG